MSGKVRSLLLVGVVLLLILGALPQPSFASKEISDWFKGSPEISNQFDMGSDPIPNSINGNRDCTEQRIITKPGKILPYAPFTQGEEAHDSCVIYTGFGAVSRSGFLQTAGEGTFGRIVYDWGGSLTLLPIPRSPNGILVVTNPGNGVHLLLVRDFLANITGATLANGEIIYTLKADAQRIPLTDSAGQKLGVRTESISFSASGKWMIADIPFFGLTRIDTNSFATRVFDTAFNYNIGTTPGVQSAVTNRGRYAVVGSASFTRLRLYDLEDCSSTTVCRYVDLYKHFKDTVPGFVSGVRFRFSTDYSVRMFMVRKVGNSNIVIRQILRANGHPAVSFGYLGLGDSFASGEGAYQYKSNTDTSLNKCHLSLQSYPYLIAEELGINEAESIACSSAVLDDIRDSGNRYPDKSQAKNKESSDFDTEIYQNFLPGYREQLDFIKEHKPEHITISAVGNDIGFGDKIKACLMPGTCFDTYESRLEVATEVNSQFDRLVNMYVDIKAEMEGKKVYVIGYPEIAKDSGNCGNNVLLDAQEVVFSNQLVRHLNDMIQAAVEKVGFFYVDIEQAFYGHRLCEANYSNTAVNGLTGGDDILDIPFTDFGGPIGNESFHPNAIGHRLLKEVILERTSNFTAQMPSPNPAAQPPRIANTMELLADMPSSGIAPKTTRYIQNLLDNQVIEENQSIHGRIEGVESGLKPSSAVEVWLHSDPVKLGDYQTDNHGNLDFSAVIPENTTLGFHTLHIYGTTLTGKQVDLQKVIHVAQAPTLDQPETGLETDTEDTKRPLSNGDPRPPEDKTEILMDTTEQTPNPQEADVVNNIEGPFFTPRTPQTQAQVASAQTPDPGQEALSATNSRTTDSLNPYLYIGAGVLFLLSVVGVSSYLRNYMTTV